MDNCSSGNGCNISNYMGGPFTQPANIVKALRFDDITDGLSNTLLLGEKYIANNGFQYRRRPMGHVRFRRRLQYV